MTLGEQLKTLRQKTGFSQELVAGVAVLVFYLAVINPRYMGRKLWWRRTKRKS